MTGAPRRVGQPPKRQYRKSRKATVRPRVERSVPFMGSGRSVSRALIDLRRGPSAGSRRRDYRFASAEDHRGRGPPRSRLVFLFAHELISRSGVGSCNSRHSVVLARAKIRVPWRGCWMPLAVVACRRPSPYLVGRPPRNNGCATRPIRRSSRRSCAEDRLDDRSRQAGRSSPPFWTNIRLAVLADLAHGGKGRTLPNRDA